MRLALVGLAAVAVWAAPAQQVAPEAAPAVAQDASTPSLAVPRDPFWPVGYTPKEPAQAAVDVAIPSDTITEDDWRLAQKKLITASVFRKKDTTTGVDRFLALINGKVVAPGETVIVSHRGFSFRFKVADITAAGAQYERVEPSK
jgi:hypothetical protein